MHDNRLQYISPHKGAGKPHPISRPARVRYTKMPPHVFMRAVISHMIINKQPCKYVGESCIRINGACL